MSIVVKKEEFSELIKELDQEIQKLKDVYNDIDNKSKKFNGNDEMWKGQTQEAVYAYYNDISKDFPDNVERIESLSTYLKTTLQNYVDAENSINEDVDSNYSNLSINE